MTQKLPFKEPGRAHKRRNNTGRLTFHFVLFALLGVMLLSLGAYGRVKLHGIYDQQLLSRRSDSLITDSTNLVKTTAEALAGTNNSLRTKISSGLSSKSRSVKNTAAQMLTTGSSDQETLAFIVDTLSQAAVSKLKDDDEAQSALKIAVTEKLSAERDNIIATVLADTNAQIQAMSIEDVRRSLTMQTPGYTMMFYSILMLWVGGVLLALGVGLGLVRYLGGEDLRKKVTDIIEPMDYLLPFFFGVIVFTLYPMVRVFIMAFQQRYKLTGEFAGWGLGNFTDVLHGIGTNLPQAIGNTFLYVILTVPISTAIALLLAYLLNQKIKLRALFQTAYFLPMVTSATAVGLVWKYMFQENYGLINWLLSLFDVAKIPWLTKSAYSMAVMVIYGIWDALPFTIILLISGLQNIDEHYYTVAKVDGRARQAHLLPHHGAAAFPHHRPGADYQQHFRLQGVQLRGGALLRQPRPQQQHVHHDLLHLRADQHQPGIWPCGRRLADSVCDYSAVHHAAALYPAQVEVRLRRASV